MSIEQKEVSNPKGLRVDGPLRFQKELRDRGKKMSDIFLITYKGRSSPRTELAKKDPNELWAGDRVFFKNEGQAAVIRDSIQERNKIDTTAIKESAEKRRATLEATFGPDKQRLTIDDGFNSTVVRTVEAAIAYLDSLGCTKPEKNEWLPKMVTFFTIGSSFLRQNKVKEIFEKEGIDWVKLSKSNTTDSREKLEKALLGLLMTWRELPVLE